MINLLQVNQKFVYFVSFIFFMKLILNFWLRNDAAQKKIKKSHIARMPQS